MNRLLLAAYPRAVRARQGQEVLACLAEAYPGRSWPPPREAVALVRAGAQARIRAVADDTARPWWLDGVHLAALVLAALALVPYLQDVWDWALRIDPGGHALGFGSTGWYPWSQGPGAQPRTLPYGLLPLVCLIALLRGRAWIALPASVAMVCAGATIGTSTFFGTEGVVGPGYYGLGAPILAHDLVLSGSLTTACAVLAICRPGRLRRRSYAWLVPVVCAMSVAGGLHIASYDPAFQRGWLLVEIAALIAAWAATAETGDHQWMIPVAAFAVVRLQAVVTQPMLMESPRVPGTAVLFALVAPLPILASAARRRQGV
ncbi:hypothetical protein [Streptomyces sp. CB01580]|uniref:hypothetical protein n=1 Tax=Streptomyces sp. CB01580 TaxID=1703933 RepID=UPI00093F3624|nr:hypothetical protein [Streptomyces sp. CB01580]OKJ42707.1 hypothetical protein AMK22_07765 [Streptomyces sp. CB01580]